MSTSSRTLLCTPLMGTTVDQMLTEMRKAKEIGADVVEDLEILIKRSPLPTLITYRPLREGGQYDGDENKRQDALRLAMHLGASYVDIELEIPTIGISMGERGLISRILSPKFGAYLTYGALEASAISAPGQPLAKDLLDLYNFRLIRPDTKVYGVISKPVGHSKSPLLFNAAFKSAGLNAVYVHLLVDDVKKFFETYSAADFVAGCSCGIPHKEVALKCMDEIDPIAKKIGAINNIVRRPDGTLAAFNTDYIGAISAIEDGLRELNGATPAVGSPLAGKLFVVLGAGGAGKALAHGAAQKGARIVVANRPLEQAKELADKVGGQAMTLDEVASFHPEDEMVLANATSVGMTPKIDQTPIPKRRKSCSGWS
ncbi:hypothetical protein CRG98_001382 [Punica granatum]|uniref:Shikimate dehydrogenase n=1 Tax=Punica granatum TaxID=22663 RepID=A0A2I0LC16_PUNGR|nr:hypothetical protein CRG98_001382 [Punica granatum]